MSTKSNSTKSRACDYTETVVEAPSYTSVGEGLGRFESIGLTGIKSLTSDERTTVFCKVKHPDPRCPECGTAGMYRDTAHRQVVDIPSFCYQVILDIEVPRYLCTNPDCPMVCFRSTLVCTNRRQMFTNRCVKWMLLQIVGKVSINQIAQTLGVSWHAVSQCIHRAAFELVYNDPHHFEGVKYLGVDEHKWKHCRGQGAPSFITIIVDLTPVKEHTGPARLLDVVPGRSAQVLDAWLAQRTRRFRRGIKHVAMDGFTGYRTAVRNQLPQAKPVMDPFHVVGMVADRLDDMRCRLQKTYYGHRGRKGEPLYRIRRLLLTRVSLLTEKQQARLEAVLGDPRFAELDVGHYVLQQVIAAYEPENQKYGRFVFNNLMGKLADMPNIPELKQLYRAFRSKWAEIIEYFHIRLSNGPVERINGMLEHLRGIGNGFRNLENYILRSLLHSGQLKHRINAL